MTGAPGVPEERGSAGTVDGLDELFAGLSRFPDLEAPELKAHDATDLLLLRAAADDLNGLGPGELVVIGDRHGALTLGAVDLGADAVRCYQDPLLGERALAENARRLGVSDRYRSYAELDDELLSGARLVLLQLPRGLDAFDEIAQAVATRAAGDVRVYAGGRVKHMTRAMNEVLARSFENVRAGLAWRKSRVLTAIGPRAGVATGFPRWGDDPDLPFRIGAYGATFGGATLDHGSRLLLADAGDAMRRAGRIVDLGCGNGVLAVSAALANPRAEVIATDQSLAAVRATRSTAEAAGAGRRVHVHRADGAEAVPDGWADLILLNPPFHTGATVHAGVAHRLIRSCARALAPGGELRIVFNSPLGYRPLVERVIGPTRQVARDRTFTVLAAVRRERAGASVLPGRRYD